jgi:hypothetical protein
MRAGSKIINGLEVPENAKIQKDKHGREFYVFRIYQSNSIFYIDIKYLDNGELYKNKFEILQPFLFDN